MIQLFFRDIAALFGWQVVAQDAILVARAVQQVVAQFVRHGEAPAGDDIVGVDQNHAV